MIVRNFEPNAKWVEPDGTLTERAKGFLRDVFVFTGAGTGQTPIENVGGNGTGTTKFLRDDGTFAVPSYPVGADPTALAGLSTVPGTSASFMRSDGAPEIDQTIVPTWTGAHTFSSTIDCASSITGDSLIAVNGFGSNGKTAQTEVTVNAAVTGTAGVTYTSTEQTMLADIKALLNQIRAALVSNGILV